MGIFHAKMGTIKDKGVNESPLLILEEEYLGACLEE